MSIELRTLSQQDQLVEKRFVVVPGLEQRCKTPSYNSGTPETHVLNHLDKESLRPTMLISATSDLLRVVKIACEFFRYECQDIRISIIDVRAAKQDSFHDMINAGAIASSLGFDKPNYFSSELFLGRIKSPAIVHQICMDQAMYDRITWIFPSLACSLSLLELTVVAVNLRRTRVTAHPLHAAFQHLLTQVKRPLTLNSPLTRPRSTTAWSRSGPGPASG